MLRAFCADPRMPSRLKLAWRWALRTVGDLRGDFREPLPFVAWRYGGGMSTEKFSLLGTGKGLTKVAVVVVVAERGESPVDEGDILARGGDVTSRFSGGKVGKNSRVVTREALGP